MRFVWILVSAVVALAQKVLLDYLGTRGAVYLILGLADVVLIAAYFMDRSEYREWLKRRRAKQLEKHARYLERRKRKAGRRA